MREPLPLATIQDAVMEFLQGRDDAVVFGAQAVNAYVDEPRMTQDIDLLSARAKELAEELAEKISQRFRIAMRIREVPGGRGYRVYQLRKSGNRHLVDVRAVDHLPPSQRIENVLVIAPAELIARKVTAYCRRRGQPKSGTDWRDLAMLLLKFPDLRRDSGPVRDSLTSAGAGAAVLEAWKEILAQEILPENEDDEF